MTAAAAPVRAITTLDLLKVLAVALMITDHVGLYFIEEPWLRVVGRGAAVIFGFLIGFSGSTRVPPSWIALGLGLTLLHSSLFPEEPDHALDILISLALTRCVMPFFERLHDENPLLLVPAGIGLSLLAEPLNAHLEYGSEVTLLALLGLAVRRDNGHPRAAAGRDAIALVALVGMSLIALRHFDFEGWKVAGCVAMIAATVLLLSRFQRRAATVPPALAPLIAFCGRNTLWIYAVHLAAFQLVVWYNALSAE